MGCRDVSRRLGRREMWEKADMRMWVEEYEDEE